MEDLLFVGVILLIAGIILIMVSTIFSSEGKVKFAFFGFIGPIPFGFGNSENLMKIAIAATIIGAVVFLLFLRHARVI